MLWNERYTKGLPALEIPDPFFVKMYEEHISKEFPNGGIALDLAAGTGRHTLFLSTDNWQVRAVDISDVAMERLAEKAAGRPVQTICTDLAEYAFPQAAFDLIVLYYHFDRALFAAVGKALKPGGLLISKQAVGKPVNPHTLQAYELLQLTEGLEQISYAERPVKERGVAEYLGRKPF
ncbi:Methyltransferase type 12 [Chitinophaga pinensis DSM 2588]|uniref:Methyltransferase type 12 n=2 Tax=Chitinophaga pinensis TaxID=79329 RepID=A0A979G6Q3_CHIPD|nr:Methyltransferase type 12 [Chitinophaga pinensis DSM 2588]